MKVDKGFEGESDSIIEEEAGRVQAVVDSIKSNLANLGMTLLEFQDLAARHVAAVKQTYARVHANYHAQFDEACDDECVFCYAEQRFSEAAAKIVASITESRGALTAAEINALALKHGVTIH